MEALVRPFQRPDRFIRQRLIAARAKQDVSSAVISWGAAGDVPTPHQIEDASDFFNFQLVDCNDRYTEASRRTTPQRITNPNDSGQYIDWDRIEQITFTKNEKQDPEASVANKLATSFTTHWAIGSDWHVVFDPDNRKCQSRFSLNNG